MWSNKFLRALIISVVGLALLLYLAVPFFFAFRVEPPDIDFDFAFPEEAADYLAAELFGGNQEKADRYREGLLELHSAAENKDFVIVYNTGGFGGTSLAVDPEWGSIVSGIESQLSEMGYTSLVVEHVRAGSNWGGYIGEVKELLTSYSTKSWELAATISFLTRYNEDVRVIITGRSFGAVFGSEVMEILESNPRVYSIEAGRPFWHRGAASERALVIESNGITGDAFSSGDVWSIIRSNLFRLPTTSKPSGGSMKIGGYYIEVPGHEYTWDHPEVRDQITVFLEEHFAVDNH